MEFTFTRREFLKHASLLTAGMGVATMSELAIGEDREKPSMIPIIDTHQHLWDLKRFRLPWVQPGNPLAKNYLVDEYAEATKGLNIVKAVYMEVDMDPSQHDEEAEWITDICKRKVGPTVAAVISGRPDSDDFRSYASRYKDSSYIKGIRRILHSNETPAGHCLNPKFVKGIQVLGELGLSFDLCMRPGELNDAATLIEQCPDTRFILDHCGNGNVQADDLTPWKRGMDAIASHKNVVCKVSGFIFTAKPYAWKVEELAPVVNHTIEAFGPDRIMFGGDWPVCTMTATFKQWLEALQQIVQSRPAQLQHKLFHDNALQFYGLS